MKSPGCVLALVISISLATRFALLLVRGETCGAMTMAGDGEDLYALRNKAFAAFRNQCRQKIASCSFTTEPHDPHTFDFILKPLTMPFRLDFKLKNKRDAMIALADNTDNGSIFAEIDIGGWTNTKSVIRACHSDTCRQPMVEHDENDMLSASESRPFWIEYKDGVVTVGKGGEQQAFLTWDAGAYHALVPTTVHVGISTWRTFRGEWVFYQFCG